MILSAEVLSANDYEPCTRAKNYHENETDTLVLSLAECLIADHIICLHLTMIHKDRVYHLS